MKVYFETKRNQNGHRQFLGIDHSRKEYATEPYGWTTRAEVIQVTAGDLRKLRSAAEAAGYTRIDNI